MSVLVTLSVKVKPENANELREWFKDEIRHSRSFDGCNGITVHVDQDDTNHLFVLGDWNSRQHHERYVSWRAEKGDVESIAEWVSEEITAYYFDSVDM